MSKKKFSARQKLNIVLESLEKGEVTSVARKYSINSSTLSTWRKRLKDNGIKIFEDKRDKHVKNLEKDLKKMEQLLGRKEVEIALLQNFFEEYQSPNGK